MNIIEQVLTKWEKWALSVEQSERNADLVDALAEIRAAQAQQTTGEEPELPEPFAYTYQNRYTDQHYLTWSKSEGGKSWVSLFTAAQMHDHFAAGVLATLRKDAERYRWLAAKATQQADSIGPIFRIDVRRKNDGTPFSLGAAIDAAMQGGQQP